MFSSHPLSPLYSRELHNGTAHQHHLAAATPLAVIDVWEHAYYLHYRSDRAAWVAKAVAHVSWSGVAARFADARQHATV